MTTMTATPAFHPAARPPHTRQRDNHIRDRYQLQLPALARNTPGICRDHAALAALEWGADRDTAQVIANELATNAAEATHAAHQQARQHAAARHAPMPVTIPTIGYRLLRYADRMRIEVWDTAPGYPQPGPRPGWDAENGRGLWIIHDLTGGHWASHPAPHERQPGQAKCVWAEIPIQPASDRNPEP